MKPDSCDEHQVVSDSCELPQGSYFHLWPATTVEPGQLAMIETSKGVRLIGRWYPALLGCNWLKQPGRLVMDDHSNCRVLGAVIASEAPPKQITNLPTGEYEQFFESPFPRSLNS